MAARDWIETCGPEGWMFAPAVPVAGALVLFSGRGVAPPGSPSPTESLARRLARAAGAGTLPIVRATQVHGRRAAVIRERPGAGATVEAGECDVLATDLSGVALAVQTADCVPILLCAPGAVATAHAGWRGSAAGSAQAAVDALRQLGAEPRQTQAWMGPSIGSCCYAVGGEVAALFAGDFARQGCAGKFHLDLKGVNRAQLEAAGIPPDAISVHPACTQCGGDRFASYRRDGAAAGRMIGLVARME